MNTETFFKSLQFLCGQRINWKHVFLKTAFPSVCREHYSRCSHFRSSGFVSYSAVLLPQRHKQRTSLSLSGQTFQNADSRNVCKHIESLTNLRQICRFSIDVGNIFKNDTREQSDVEEEIDVVKIGGSESLAKFNELLQQNSELELSFQDWDDLRGRLLAENPRFEKSWEGMCMKLIYATGNINLGSCFLDYIRSQGRLPNITTLAIFISLCGIYGKKNKQTLIYTAFRQLQKQSDVFDGIIAKLLIRGFCATEEWRKSLEFIDMAKLTCNPGSGYYSPIVVAALREKDNDTAFSLLNVMGQLGITPQESVFKQFVEMCGDETSAVTVEVFMEFLRKYQWFPSKKTAAEIESLFLGSKQHRWKCRWTTIDSRGVCRSCWQRLEQLEINNADFEALQREFLENALVGDNVYLKSNPEEVEKFKDFVQASAPFDVVLDALNVAHNRSSKNKSQKSTLLRKAVEYFAKYKRQRVLVIGRDHMKRWPPRDMITIEKLAQTFYTENISKDDPFLLYAAMYSGKSSMIVSDDYMRDHKFTLGPHLRDTFEKWQRSVQITDLRFSPGEVTVQMPSKHETGPQKDAKGWHIPYDDSDERLDRHVYQRPNTWLCLRYVEPHTQKKRGKN